MNSADHSSKLDDLVSFIRSQISEPNLQITQKTLIEDELGVTGDDAEELIIAFSERYGVNIANFNFTTYFYDEPGIFDLQNHKIKPLTVGHLEKAIIASRLDDEIIDS